MSTSRRFWLAGALLLLVGVPALAQYTTSDTLEAVVPGLVYREYSIIMTGNDWRVTDPDASHSGAQAFLPNPVLGMTVGDLDGAIRAAAVIDVWGGHVGTVGKQFRFNGNEWIDIPDIVGTPGSPECYNHQASLTVEVPLAHLVEGANTLEGTSGGQTCYNFGWGQWGWYGLLLRVYYDPAAKTPPDGEITSPQSGGILSPDPVFSVDASSPSGIDRVEVIGHYDAYDPDGDGLYLEWQQSYHRLAYTGSMTVREHIGTAESAPWAVTWDTEWVLDQPPGGVKAVARIRDGDGLFRVTEQVTGLTLDRPEASVQLYRAEDVPMRYWVRAGRLRSNTFTIPADANLAYATGARLLAGTWNGVAGHSEPGEEHWRRVNGWTTPVFGRNHFYSYDEVVLPTDILQTGAGTVEFYAESSHHGIEIMWPGPGVVVRYEDQTGVPAYVVEPPQDASVVAGTVATFSVTAAGELPVAFQWQRNGADVPGADGPSLAVGPVALGDDGDQFRCVVSNVHGSETSAAATLTVLEPGDRVTDGLLALYTFAENGGTVVHDQAGAGPPLDLTIADPAAVSWSPGALTIASSTLVASDGPAADLSAAVAAAGELTLEAWVRPASVDQNGPARIVSISGGPSERNLTLGQGVAQDASDVFDVRLRTTATDDNGIPSLTSPEGDLTGDLAHVVFTRGSGGTTRLYIDGVERSTGNAAGDLTGWDTSFPLLLGNETTGDRPWLGDLHLVAFFDRALSLAEVQQNHLAGPDPETGPTTVPALDAVALEPGVPNPFNPRTTIGFAIPAAGEVVLAIHDLRGRLVTTLLSRSLPAGRHQAEWNGRDATGAPVGSGVYLCRLTVRLADGTLADRTRSLTLLK